MNFKLFQAAVAKQFARLSVHDLFVTSVTKDDLWATYLGAFPEGSNPIYKTRTEHDCQCCKQFIRVMGNVVAIIDGKIETIWDIDLNELNYQAVALAMRDKVASQPITDIFLHYEKTAGTARSLQDTLDGVKAWDHFHVTIPAKFVKPNDAIPTALGKARDKHQVFSRGLRELSVEALDTVLELIAQNSLYRGEEHKFAVSTFRNWKVKYDAKPDPTTTWVKLSTVPDSVAFFRNSSIGTLVTALSNGTDIDTAVRAFEAMVAPANYKRPTALVTKAMIEKAKKDIEALGLTPALERRYATVEDITINNVMWASTNARKALTGNVFDDLAAAVPVQVTTKVEEVSIEKFIVDILPTATSLELLVDNAHAGNFVTLVAPVDPTAPGLFKWGNNFSWSYNGDLADSMKERVKKAGGNVTGDLCCRLAWFNHDDLDFHMKQPNGKEIYFANKRPVGGGTLDVDMNAGHGDTKTPVENIVYAHRRDMDEGTYKLFVNQFCARDSADQGFEVEIDFMGTVYRFSYPQPMRSGSNVTVAEFDYSHKDGIKFIKSLPSTQLAREVWGVKTATYQPVKVVMMSPNFWDGQVGIGNRHFFFMLEGCVNEGTARPFFNEFLKSELDPHRKVLEMVGAKMRTSEAERQLSGLGFSSTQRNSVLCRVTGSFTRTLKLVF